MRLRMFGVLAIFVLFGALAASGCKQATRKYWISEMSKKGPHKLCEEGTYFRECFAVSKDECLEVMTETTKQCLERYRSRIPKVLMQPADGRKWGAKVGACAGATYEKRLKTRMQATPKCREIVKSLQQER